MIKLFSLYRLSIDYTPFYQRILQSTFYCSVITVLMNLEYLITLFFNMVLSAHTNYLIFYFKELQHFQSCFKVRALYPPFFACQLLFEFIFFSSKYLDNQSVASTAASQLQPSTTETRIIQLSSPLSSFFCKIFKKITFSCVAADQSNSYDA